MREKLSNSIIKDIFRDYTDLQEVKTESAEILTIESAMELFAIPCNGATFENLDVDNVELFNQFWDEDSIIFSYDEDKKCSEIVNKKGKIVKRISKFLKKNGIKLENKDIGKMGNFLKSHGAKEETFFVDVYKCSDGIYWDDGDFGNSGSCWFPGGEYSASIPTFENSDNTYCLRLYSNDNQRDENGYSRTWVNVKYDTIQIFNSYGVESETALNIILTILKNNGYGAIFSKQNVYNSENCNVPYINGNSNFVVGDIEKTLDSGNYDIDLEIYGEVFENYCEMCGDGRLDEDSYYIESSEEYVCSDCLGNNFTYCENCNQYHRDDEVYETESDGSLCEGCIESGGYMRCESCDEYTQNYILVSDAIYCETCVPDSEVCESCGERLESEDMEEIGESFFCPDCKDEAEEEQEKIDELGYSPSGEISFDEHISNGQATYLS